MKSNIKAEGKEKEENEIYMCGYFIKLINKIKWKTTNELNERTFDGIVCRSYHSEYRVIVFYTKKANDALREREKEGGKRNKIK